MTRGRFFKGLQNYIENKKKGNENKIILGDFNCTMDKMDKDGGNKTRKTYTCRSNHGLSKLIVDNGLEDLWRRKNPDFSEFNCYNRSSGTNFRRDRVNNDIKIANHIMVYFTDYYNTISIDRLTSKTKIGKYSWYFDNSPL